MTIKFNVMQKDIDKANQEIGEKRLSDTTGQVKNYICKCPIAQALTRKFGIRVAVTSDSFRFGNDFTFTSFSLDKKSRNVIFLFDSKDKVIPAHGCSFIVPDIEKFKRLVKRLKNDN